MSESMNIIITGVGGQGNVLAARLLASAALRAGREVSVGDVYGLTQRGGSVASHVRWRAASPAPPLTPEGSLDVLAAFEPLEALRLQVQYGGTETEVLVNDQPVMPIGVQAGRFAYPDAGRINDMLCRMSGRTRYVSATAAARALGNIQVLNTVMLGVLAASGLTGIDADLFEEVIRDNVPQRLVSLNTEAFRRGMGLLGGDA